jgi:anaerobic selenocysteine-containing dehydrogenase
MLETPGTSLLMEAIKYNAHSRGIDQPYARYAPAVVAPPADSDLMGDWEFFYEMARRMNVELTVRNYYRAGNFQEAPPLHVRLDPERRPSTDELIDMLMSNSRVPLSEVRKYPHGHVFTEVRERVQPRDPGCTAKLDIGNITMMTELDDLAARLDGGRCDDTYPLRLVPRRVNHLVNSYGRASEVLNTRKPYNPICIHPEDATRYGLADGADVLVQSRFDQVRAIIEFDDGIRPGVASMTHCYGRNPDEAEDPRIDGASVGRLLSVEDEPDPITGIPRMGALPIKLVPVC